MTDFIDRYRVLRRLVLLWAVGIITVTVSHYLPRMGQIQGPDATVILGIIGILTVVVGLYDRRS